ncbi:MAG: hypothetical protein J6T10_00785 [Methanobrevibacter sp.]|nr:hypothetical protein [Methanobrevibacter sp.]
MLTREKVFKMISREKALHILSVFQKSYREESEMYQALQVAIDDIALVINLLSVYGDDSIGEDWLLVIDDIIKGFIEMENK